MKLNKFLVAAAAVAVLPLSVASAAEVLDKPELVLDASGKPAFEKSHGTPAVENKEEYNPVAETSKVRFDEKTGKTVQYSHGLPATAEKAEFRGGVNGAEAAVAEKPEYKAEKATDKKATDRKVRRVLPKTHAVK